MGVNIPKPPDSLGKMTPDQNALLGFWFYNNLVPAASYEFGHKVRQQKPEGPTQNLPYNESTLPLGPWEIPLLYTDAFRRVLIYPIPQPNLTWLDLIQFTIVAYLYAEPSYKITSALLICPLTSAPTLTQAQRQGINVALVPVTIAQPTA